MCQNINGKSVRVLTLTVVSCFNWPASKKCPGDLKFTTVFYSFTFTGENKHVIAVWMKNNFKRFSY